MKVSIEAAIVAQFSKNDNIVILSTFNEMLVGKKISDQQMRLICEK